MELRSRLSAFAALGVIIASPFAIRFFQLFTSEQAKSSPSIAHAQSCVDPATEGEVLFAGCAGFF